MMTQPPFLISGDGLAIVSPASIINPDYVKGAVERLESWPLGVSVSLHCLGESGVYSGTVDERTDDFRNALYTPEVKAILCSRGGYGTVHLLDRLTDGQAQALRRELKLHHTDLPPTELPDNEPPGSVETPPC